MIKPRIKLLVREARTKCHIVTALRGRCEDKTDSRLSYPHWLIISGGTLYDRFTCTCNDGPLLEIPETTDFFATYAFLEIAKKSLHPDHLCDQYFNVGRTVRQYKEVCKNMEDLEHFRNNSDRPSDKEILDYLIYKKSWEDWAKEKEIFGYGLGYVYEDKICILCKDKGGTFGGIDVDRLSNFPTITPVVFSKKSSIQDYLKIMEENPTYLGDIKRLLKEMVCVSIVSVSKSPGAEWKVKF